MQIEIQSAILPIVNFDRRRETLKNKIPQLLAMGLLFISGLACNIGKGPQTGTTQDPATSNATATEPAANNSASAGACDNQYYPVKPGVTWNYNLTGSVS